VRILVASVLFSAGCHGPAVSRWRADFGGFAPPIDTRNADCSFDTVDQLLSCAGLDGSVGSGREVDVSILGGVTTGVSYVVGAAAKPYATVAWLDPTALDLASGPRQWSGADGQVAVTLWDGARVAFRYQATMKPADPTTMGAFTLTGDAFIVNVRTLR
jgi:hypothetical protein